MKSRFVMFALIVSSTSFLAFAGPTIDSTAAMPLGIATNTSTVVTVLAKISDPSVIPESVNLLRINGPGEQPTILGVLHDDGQAGDLVAGDQVYTLQVTFDEGSPGQIQLQVSAAFLGQLLRVKSPVMTISVTVPVDLPPDPGPGGMTTLAGVDSDGDGVRDDVQRYIALTYPDSAKTRAALTQITRAMQPLLLDASNQQAAISDVVALGHGIECSIFTDGPTRAAQEYHALRAQVLNTLPRVQAYLTADSQFSSHVYKLAPNAQKAALCTVDPSTLPN